MDKLKLRLMYQEALQRLKDAETLSQVIPLGERTDSAYILQLLGLELLLKIVFETALSKPGVGHKYEKLFGELPQSLQTRLLASANKRVQHSELAINHERVLEEWGKNFVDLRYPWERYATLSEEQYSSLGEEWVSKGAPLEEATFRYHPEELFSFIEALRIVAAEVANL
ncbi:uncharacterized protein NMK_3417 [Novimethylophilus kurashikiensis]|uniref:HEPN domain-containing protein n=2 Tax=Novimethylophilus kurashikiensis TaxID=1825523 RepID=A0A2R5FCS0_9PROT|nr:uncharacterized protein NMK_3417 [Novimethylophilus kurashikiensis]